MEIPERPDFEMLVLLDHVSPEFWERIKGYVESVESMLARTLRENQQYCASQREDWDAIKNARARLDLARKALVQTGYFKEDEVDDDVAPRIIEMASAFRQQEQGERVMGDRYFFAQDDSFHWYLVDASRRDEWSEWREIPENDERAWEAPEFAQRLGGGPESWTFVGPKERE